MSYIGSTPTSQNFISGTDYFNGDGSTTAFTLTRTVNSVNDVEVVINNVVQQPSTAYTLSGTTITFTSAPSSGTSNIYVRYLSTTTQSITPSQGTVGWAQLNSDVQQDLGISFKNRLINGAMVLDQRNAGASVSVDGAEVYTLDRWKAVDGSDGVFSVQQDSSAPAGFNNSLKVTVTTADASIGATQYAMVRQTIEGFNFADFGFGTANAKTVTISFWVRSSLTGTFGGCLWNSNGGSPRCYPYTYTINAANTWEQKSVTIVGDQSGTWTGATSGSAAVVDFTLAMGSTYSGPAGAWAGSLYLAPTGLTQVMSTLGATLYITGVQLEVGTQATTFDYRSYGTELSLCQRYYEVLGYGCIAMAESGSTYVMNLPYRVTKRAAASIGLTVTSNIRVRQFGVADRDAASPSAGNVAGSTTGGTFKVSGFSSIGSASTPAGIGYTTTSEDGNLFFASAEL